MSETSINERVNSALYSDVINSYVDINSITAQRNIVAGSYRETIQQATDQTLATMNSTGGQTLFTRLLLSPQVRNATLAQLAQIYFEYIIPGNSLAVIVAAATNNAVEPAQGTDTKDLTEHLQFKLFYDSGFSIASMVQLCLTADSKISTENFNYQQCLLTLNSLPDFATENSLSESTLSGLVNNKNYAGVGSGIVDVKLGSNAAVYAYPIAQDIAISGLIDLNKGNPLFHNFPIITRNMGNIYIRLYMENFLRELKIVYLNKRRNPVIGGSLTCSATTATQPMPITAGFLPESEILPFQRLPADKADYVYLNGQLHKVKLCNNKGNIITPTTQNTTNFNKTVPIYSLDNIQWQRFEIRKIEFDIEDFEDIKASQARAGTYKCPVHLWRSKPFDQTNAASASANALQTTLNAPNIDRLFITQPLTRDYYTFCPTITTTDINPQLYNNPVLPRTEDTLNSKVIERIGSVFVDTDKYSIPRDLFDSLNLPTLNKKLYLKSGATYGGNGAFAALQKLYYEDIDGSNTTKQFNKTQLFNNDVVLIPNKFAYALELNAGGCFRRGFNSVIDGKYSPVVPINFQQSVSTSDNVYTHSTYTATANSDLVNTSSVNNAHVVYGDIRDSGAVASVHCLCDYILWFSFDNFGNLADFGVSEYNDRN